MSHVSVGGSATTGSFEIAPGNVVLSADLDRVLEQGDEEIGWLAKEGRLALGYLGDAAKTRARIRSGRCALRRSRRPRRLLDGGVVELHGRDAVTINSGGEKIFAEEVESAIKAHPAVYDCVVAGRPSERWGNEVVAIVRIRAGYEVDDADSQRGRAPHRPYKLPKTIVYVDEVQRSPSGKADYRWAKQVAAASA